MVAPMTRRVKTGSEPKYTLDEARKILKYELCEELHGGHDIQLVHYSQNAAGRIEVRHYACDRCALPFAPVYPSRF